jgi:phage portal protein BeeE
VASIRAWFQRDRHDITEATRALTPAQLPERAGYVYGIPRGGLNETNAGIGASTQTDRRSQLQQLYEAYLSCPWAWACVNAIARTITAGGLVMDWDTDTGEDEEAPEKPENVLAVERLFKYTNDRQNIRQLLRNVVIDLLVFGDAYIELAWWGNVPVALYNLDVPTTTPTADEHGKITAWTQTTEYGQIAHFEPRDVIHISLDAPRSGVFGVSPTQANLLPITAWLFAAATLKEMFRKGLPPTVHADFPSGVSKTDQELWVAQTMSRNVGPRNIGRPWVTKGGGVLKELQAGKVADAINALNQKRDEIIGGYGVPPAKVSIIESGNLGGGTGEEQDRALDLYTMIPTPTGWTTMGELKVGEQVLDEAGRPCKVTGTYEVPNAQSWRLEFSDGTHLDCCLDHLWVTWTEQDRKAFGRSKARGESAVPENWPEWKSGRGLGPQVRRTEEVISTLESRPGWKNHSIPVTGALQLPDADLPIDPYVLGVWLGDGYSHTGAIAIAEGEEQIASEIRAAGFTVTEWASQRAGGRVPTYNAAGLRTPLRKAGLLANKHVPAEYLRASAAQRLALLQGLMDTDGGFSSGQQVLFRNTNERLADAVMELARSLGQKPVKTKGRSPLIGVRGQERDNDRADYGPSYAVTWTPTIQVFRLKRKAEKWNPLNSGSMKLGHRYIVAAHKIPDRPMRCIRVDSPNAMYLAGEQMIPTHNTYKVDVCQPIAELVLEAVNFAVIQNGFGVQEWHAKFGEVDYRSSKLVSDIQDQRIRNGSTSINAVRAENGEPPVDGGDDPVIIDRQNLVLVRDLAAMSAATVAGQVAKGVLPAGPDQAAAGGLDDGGQATEPPDGGKPQGDGKPGEPPEESVPVIALARYRKRLAEALRSMPATDAISETLRSLPFDESSWDGGQPVMRAVASQLARKFPPDAIDWVKTAKWQGPRRVPIASIDLDDRGHWSASREPGVIRQFVKKLRRRHAEGRELKPAVVVQRPEGKLLIADGHHRFLAYEKDGQDYLWAYVGRVSKQEGPWDRLALSQAGENEAA